MSGAIAVDLWRTRDPKIIPESETSHKQRRRSLAGNSDGQPHTTALPIVRPNQCEDLLVCDAGVATAIDRTGGDSD